MSHITHSPAYMSHTYILSIHSLFHLDNTFHNIFDKIDKSPSTIHYITIILVNYYSVFSIQLKSIIFCTLNKT